MTWGKDGGGCPSSFPEIDKDFLYAVPDKSVVSGEFGCVMMKVTIVFAHQKGESFRVVVLQLLQPLGIRR